MRPITDKDIQEYSRRGLDFINELPEVTGTPKSKRWIRAYFIWLKIHVLATKALISTVEIEKLENLALKDDMNFEKIRKR